MVTDYDAYRTATSRAAELRDEAAAWRLARAAVPAPRTGELWGRLTWLRRTNSARRPAPIAAQPQPCGC